MKKKITFIIACIIVVSAKAQPYVDLLNTSYTGSLFNNSNATTFTHLYVGSDLPFQLQKNKLIVLSPFYEQWMIDSARNKHFLPTVNSVVIAISAIVPLDKNHWTLSITAIPRFNSEALHLHNIFQSGGVLLTTYKKNNNLKYKLGVYVNNEFFGLFVMPLAGIDWRINNNNNLFGVLPSRITYEHKVNATFYIGAAFRAITNSYRLDNGNYLRIDDNQTSIYLDVYAAKHIVFSGEAGYGIFRKIRTGNWHNKDYSTSYCWNDGPFFRLTTSYRIRLKK